MSNGGGAQAPETGCDSPKGSGVWARGVQDHQRRPESPPETSDAAYGPVLSGGDDDTFMRHARTLASGAS
jgi:hypothetical protein